MAWWRSYFDEVFFRLHEPLFSEERSREEVGAILDLLGLPSGARIMDIPCGWGRHANLIPDAGLETFGADISVPLLERAVRGARETGIPPRFAAADLRALPFADGAFDAVINVFTSLGLFETDEEDLATLREAHRVLGPGGRLLLESMHRDDVVCSYAEKDRWTLPGGIEVRARRRFDPVRGISHERMYWTMGEERGEKHHTLRLRTATEIDRLLTAAGFVEIEYFGDWSGEPFTHTAPRLIAVARRSD